MKVYSAINAVQAELARDGITKSRKNQQQGYNFRGIDDVYNALSPLLAKHGLCILPRILTRECHERATQKGGVLFYVTVEAEFDFVCAEDGSKHVVRTFGEAMDSADKATNKAMSAAYKYAAFQAFAIPTEADNDADAHTPQAISADEARRIKCHELCEEYAASIDAIKRGIDSDDFYSAAEAWFELDQDVMRGLWVAPTKGGPFTTKQREIMKSDAFTKYRQTAADTAKDAE